MRNDLKQTLAAGLGGVIGTAVDVVVLATLVERGAPMGWSAFAGALAGAGVSFVMNKHVAFRDGSPVNVRQVAAFGFVALVTALMMAAGMQLVALALGAHYLVAKAICATAVFVVWSYPAQKRLVFRPSPRSPAPVASLA